MIIVPSPGPEGGAGAGAPPTLWLPDESVTLRARPSRKLAVAFLKLFNLSFYFNQSVWPKHGSNTQYILMRLIKTGTHE